MSAILLKNITVSNSLKDILIRGGRIINMEPAGSCAGWDFVGNIEIMDCTGKVAIPGFVNMHSHAAMSLMRGVGEDLAFHDWIARLWAIEDRIDEEYIYWATKVACVEMIRTGTTTFNDQYWHHDVSRKAAREMGMRIATGYDILDRNDPAVAAKAKEECIAQTEEALSSGDEGDIYQLAFHAVYTVSEDMIRWVTEYAENLNLRLHIHLCETAKEVNDCRMLHGGLSPVEYLEELGVLSERLIAAHTLWLSDNDIRLLGSRHVNCVHNINSNSKLASGYRFLYNELRDSGANVCLGTDGCASSNNLDMLEAMKTSALFQKAWRNDPSAMPINELLDMATINGARALGLNSGRLEPGALADITIIDTDNSFFLSPAPFLANLIYSAHSDCIDSVICGGRFLMRHREIAGEREIYRQAAGVISKITT